jgi:triacylglycerol lipase
VASVRPDLVASVTSVGGPNRGTKAVDLYLGLAPDGSLPKSILISVSNGMAKLISFISGKPDLPQDALAAAKSLSTPGSLQFNSRHPAGVPTSACGEGDYSVNGVAYYSWSGAQTMTNLFDVTDLAMSLTSLAFGGAKNDGLVEVCSSHLGKVIRDDYAMNHVDEINHAIGLVNIFETNPVTIYRQHANRLKNSGL